MSRKMTEQQRAIVTRLASLHTFEFPAPLLQRTFRARTNIDTHTHNMHTRTHIHAHTHTHTHTRSTHKARARTIMTHAHTIKHTCAHNVRLLIRTHANVRDARQLWIYSSTRSCSNTLRNVHGHPQQKQNTLHQNNMT